MPNSKNDVRYIVVVTTDGMFDSLLPCGIVDFETAELEIKKAKEEDKQRDWQYEYKIVSVDLNLDEKKK
ncbi:hypothetical protein KC622_03605 [Candidatus Dojkabacteria bacterium]|uniref:Uncharacterized protein n=1 Tax=Candidatus Dojkabacteria bacterium TaxID=2099670 RepID=A0A955HYJ9_9BACT|nr:hypothetical protein [Candidatus Dojkabacteria bacterium]